jgi:hypothetical protein
MVPTSVGGLISSFRYRHVIADHKGQEEAIKVLGSRATIVRPTLFPSSSNSFDETNDTTESGDYTWKSCPSLMLSSATDTDSITDTTTTTTKMNETYTDSAAAAAAAAAATGKALSRRSLIQQKPVKSLSFRRKKKPVIQCGCPFATTITEFNPTDKSTAVPSSNITCRSDLSKYITNYILEKQNNENKKTSDQRRQQEQESYVQMYLSNQPKETEIRNVTSISTK